MGNDENERYGFALIKKKISAIVLAAGKGSRMNTPVVKQYLLLQDKPVLYYSLKAFEDSNVDEIILVTGRDQEEYCWDNIIKPYHLSKVTQIIEGGKERYDSVYHALLQIQHTDYVLIHDGARPFITANVINDMITQVIQHKACILATPVKETIKVVDSNGYITATPNRNTLWSAQTPQAFDYEMLMRAYTMFFEQRDGNEAAVTDDAMVYGNFLGEPVKIIHGDYRNIKITTTEDMAVAKVILNELLF